jgi:tetratricopeptide (TPR) repeat protein
VNWTKRGIELAEQRVSASYWLGPLLNNLGWEYYEAGEFESAVEAFERALRAREADPENAAAIEIAQYAVGKALRALDRPDEAIPVLEEAVASATQRGAADGWLHEELAEEYATVGRPDDARVHARLAIPLLKAHDPSFPEDAERRNRLDALADGSA